MILQFRKRLSTLCFEFLDVVSVKSTLAGYKRACCATLIHDVDRSWQSHVLPDMQPLFSIIKGIRTEKQV